MRSTWVRVVWQAVLLQSFGATGVVSSADEAKGDARSTADGLAAAARASDFLMKCEQFARRSMLNASFGDQGYAAPLRRGVVYAAVGTATVRKATTSALGVRRVHGRAVGTLLVTGRGSFDALAPSVARRGPEHWWDHVACVDGYGIDFEQLPEFEAFTAEEHRAPKDGSVERVDLDATKSANAQLERQRVKSKPQSWAAVRQLRSAKMVALLLALQIFDVAIFLDADTSPCAPLDRVFEAVAADGAWFAFVPAPARHHAALLERLYGLKDADEPPEPNTGVVAIAATEGARDVLRRWSEVYWRESLALTSLQNPMDQPPFRVALWQLALERWTPLERSNNCRGHASRDRRLYSGISN